MAEDEAASQALPCSSTAESTDPSLSLSRNVSFSRLNAQAPEFVPSPRSAPDLHSPIPMPPSPSPPPPPPPPPPPQSQGVLHIYHPPPPPAFHVPIRPHVPVVPNRPIKNYHHHHHHPHPHPHPIKHQHHQHHMGPHFHPQHHYYGGFGEQEVSLPQPQPQPQPKASAPSDQPKPSSSSAAKLSDDSSLKLLNQVEYYFSDLNLATTDHLMRFIGKDPEGFVPISVVASFKKIKALINGHAQLATTLRNSSKLVVSEDGKKVRRLHPITESDMEELQSRIIVAENLPEDHCHQNLMKVFSAVGSVKTIRTCQPQTPNGGASSASRSAKSDNMHYSNKVCLLQLP